MSPRRLVRVELSEKEFLQLPKTLHGLTGYTNQLKNNINNNNNNNNIVEKISLTTMLTIKILFTINSLEKKNKNYSFKTLYTIPVDIKST